MPILHILLLHFSIFLTYNKAWNYNFCESTILYSGRYHGILENQYYRNVTTGITQPLTISLHENKSTIHMNKKINMGFLQQTFKFDRPNEQNSKKEVLAFIDSTIAGSDRVTLDQIINHFSTQSDKSSKAATLHLVNELFRDDKIHYIIGGKKFLYENIKSFFLDSAEIQLKLKRRDSFLILKTYFLEPARWPSIEIVKPEVVEKSALLNAQHLGRELFKTDVPVSQNSLCQSIRRYLRMWRSQLEEFYQVGGTGNYPGINEIQKGLDLLNKHLSAYDPYQFIETFLDHENRLYEASSDFAVLKNFYKDQIGVWNMLIEAVENFEPNRMLLAKNPDAEKALEILCKILKEPKPYSMIKEISGLISTVKAANDPIVDEQIASARALAVERIEEKIDKIVRILNEKNANGDTRNKALFPLQTGKKKIKMASNIQNINDYLNEGIDQFDDALDMLGLV